MRDRILPREIGALVVRIDGLTRLIAFVAAATAGGLLAVALLAVFLAGHMDALSARFGPAWTLVGLTPVGLSFAVFRLIEWLAAAWLTSYAKEHHQA